MCSHERLLDYLYDELAVPERESFERHLRDCTACRTDLAELRGARVALASWTPPAPEPGLRIVRGPDPTASAPARRFFNPAWGLAAAAVLVLAAAAAIANVEARYDAGGFVVRTGWADGETSGSTAARAALTPVSASDQWKADVQQLETRLQQLEQANRPVRAAALGDEPSASATTRPAGQEMTDAELLRAVRRIIAESEARQQRELAIRVAQVLRDVDTARVGDLARIEQGLRQMQGLTDAELILQRDTLQHLLRVTQRRE
jgi:anti-sigma factor RsiW